MEIYIYIYLFRTLEEFGLGQNIIDYISVLYSNPIPKCPQMVYFQKDFLYIEAPDKAAL